MNNSPLISFCIATYKRPTFLKSTIQSILKQKYDNYEIVVCEDDSDMNSESVIKSFKSKKIIYKKNKIELGMTKSYNRAISLANGKFITLLADDDPPTENMLKIFMDAYKKYPNEKAFWGASYVKITSEKIEKVTHLTQGLHSLENKNKPSGSIELLNPHDFFIKFFKQEIFPHYQWTACVVAKEILQKINKVPDYNSAHFIDYAYILKIAAKTKFVIVNKAMAVVELHVLSYGKKQDTLNEYKRGVIGFHKIASPLSTKLNCEEDYQQFLSNYIIMFLVNRLEHYKTHNYQINVHQLFKVYTDLCKKLPFLKKRKLELYFKLTIYYRYKFVYHTINFLRTTYGQIKLN